MIRLVTLAALVASIAVPASAHEVRVSLASKSPAQVAADVRSAARSVCMRATSTESFRIQAFNRCLKDTVAVTMAKVSGAELASTGATTLAQR